MQEGANRSALFANSLRPIQAVPVGRRYVVIDALAKASGVCNRRWRLSHKAVRIELRSNCEACEIGLSPAATFLLLMFSENYFLKQDSMLDIFYLRFERAVYRTLITYQCVR
jgi:hypothetical protein